MRQLRQQEQQEAVNALTPAHRTLLSQVVGQLRNQQNPDMQSAARTLDNALSPTERQSVVSIAGRYAAQMRQLRQNAGGQAPGPQGQMWNQGSASATAARNAMRNDPGYILLRMSIGHRWHRGSANTPS